MVLEGGPEGQISLAENLVPRRFSGDWKISGRLLAGPVRDFNLMARRDRYDSSLEMHEIASELRLDAAAATLLVHILDGEVATSDHVLARGETLASRPRRNEPHQAAGRNPSSGLLPNYPTSFAAASSALRRSTSAGGISTLLASEKAS